MNKNNTKEFKIDKFSAVKRTEMIKNAYEKVKGDWMLYALLMPLVIWFLLWQYKPMAGLLVAFKDYDAINGVGGSPFLGIHYFKELLVGQEAVMFWQAFRNTFVLSAYGLVFGFPIPIILAIFFSEITKTTYRNVVQTITYLPHFMSEVTITGLVIVMVSNTQTSQGVIAQFLESFGIIDEGVNVLKEAKYFRPIYQIVGIWKQAGYSSIVYFAAIMGVSPTLYEALKVDGGNKLQEIRFVTLPGISSTLIIMIILRIGRMLTVGYERVILLYSADIYRTADVLSTYVYRIGIGESSRPALASAAGMFNSVIAFGLVVSANLIAKRISKTSLW